MSEEITVKLRELVVKARKKSVMNKVKIGVGSLFASIGMAFLALTPMMLIDNVLRDVDKWNILLLLMIDFIIIAILMLLSTKFKQLRFAPNEDRLQTALSIADYIEKGAEFKFVGDLNKDFAVEINRSERVKFEVGDELIKSSGLMEGTYVNQYGFKRILALGIDDVIDYEDKDALIDEVLSVKVKNDEILTAYNHNRIAIFQDRDLK